MVNNANITISTEVSGRPLTSCLMNASGVWCTEADQLTAMLESNAGAVVTKSCTLEYRKGNEVPRYRTITQGSINSMGLPNNGLRYYLDFVEKNAGSNKPIILSVAGLNHEENVALVKIANSCDTLQGIELNLSCPNIAGKPQTGYDFEATRSLLDLAFGVCSKKMGVKLPPYFDLIHFEIMADVLRQYPLAYVCCVNSIGNGLFIDVDTETVGIKPKNGFGGIGGLYIKPTALANVRKFYELLPGVDIIGCGGVQNGADVFEHILCGASVVQIGTTLWEEGPDCFNRIENELKEIMIYKGYSSIEEFKGNLKVMR